MVRRISPRGSCRRAARGHPCGPAASHGMRNLAWRARRPARIDLTGLSESFATWVPDITELPALNPRERVRRGRAGGCWVADVAGGSRRLPSVFACQSRFGGRPRWGGSPARVLPGPAWPAALTFRGCHGPYPWAQPVSVGRSRTRGAQAVPVGPKPYPWGPGRTPWGPGPYPVGPWGAYPWAPGPGAGL